ncbi:MAG: VCBS repeat-containing protein [Bacteroidota bacterium]
MFASLSSAKTHINFSNDLQKRKAFGILYYLYYYNGGGVSIGDINNDGLPDIYFTANSKGNNKLYLNKGNFEFEDITQKAGVAGIADWCTGSTMADVNGDGLMDIYVCAVQGEHGLKGRNALFINNGPSPSPSGEGPGEVTFTESAVKYGLDLAAFSTQAVFFDFDHDGDLDCFVLNQSHHPNETIKDTSFRRSFDGNAGDRLYRNDLATLGKFTDISAQAGISQSSLGYGLGIAVADMNNDGWDDIYIGNDFHENDYYYLNNGPSPAASEKARPDDPARRAVVSFTESGAKHFGHYSRFSMGNDIADYDNDGQPDVVTADMLPPDEKTLKTYGSDENFDTYSFKIKHNGFQDQVSRNCLQRNNGSGQSFSDVALMEGISATDWSWCPLFADFDNDGNKDLFVSSGIVKRPVDMDYVRFVSNLARKVDRNNSDQYDEMTVEKMPDGASHPFFFKGSGGGPFKDVSNNWGTGTMKGYFNGAAYADLDNDGNIDMVVNCLNAPALIMKNNAPKQNSLSVKLKGDGMNRFGIGAKLYVFSKGKQQYQQLMLTRGFQSSSDASLHFGLGADSTIDSMLVVWPDQQYQVLKNIVANKNIALKQADAAGHFEYEAFFHPAKPMFTDVSDQVKCNWQHRENDFVDFNVQYLIPHEESTRGPKLAAGDINKDGLDDFYACGAKGQPGTLMEQQKDGSFKAIDTALFAKYAPCEDVDAVFFDANGDGWQDLLVISGGNEPNLQSPFLLTDRLFINNGKGHFTNKSDFAIQKFYNKSCVAVADVDHDGDMDFFVGTLSNTYSTEFGKPMTSYLYLNDGKGKFAVASFQTIQLSNLGTVTSAVFTDLNHDGWADLVVTGEWMPMKIFMNNHGKFTERDVPNSTGLWQTVFASDLNGDGYPDLLAGNWGHNSKLWERKKSPLKLYVKDFDNNMTVEQVLCYTAADGQEYTFLAKDELEKELPVLKKAYLNYSDVAGKTVQYTFYDLFKDYLELKAETLSSCSFMNDGKGNFSMQELPATTQMAPVFAFAAIDGDKQSDYMAVGNFYGVMPYEGRYDALFPTIFSAGKSEGFNSISNLPSIPGEMRDAKWLNCADGKKLLVLARNNGKLAFLQKNQ